MLTINIILFILSTIAYLEICSAKDYCGAEFCKNTKEHTMCKYMSSEPAGHCYGYEKTILNENMKQNILDKINNRRNKVAAGEIRSLPPAGRMLKLEWNTELEMFAQRWADQCVKRSVPDKKDDCRDLGNMAVGQNIATIHGDAPGLTPLALVDVWYMELLNTNTSILSHYVPSSDTASSHYDYFTQLVWEDSNQVGCGAVKFKELQEDENIKYGTIYRLVCNFAPGGNRRNKTVYSSGRPCSKCPADWSCDQKYKALCTRTSLPEDKYLEDGSITTSSMKSNKLVQQYTEKHVTAEKVTDTAEDATDLSENLSDSLLQSEKDTFTTFDYFSHLYDYTKQSITPYTKPNSCKNIMVVDDFVELLKKKLSNDPVIKDLLTTSKSALNSMSESPFNDDGVVAFVDKLYSKKLPSTTKKNVESDHLNSTFLVDLIEAVIFRNGEKLPVSEELSHYTLPMSSVKPILIQAELAEVKQNEDFTGHYFFPEDDEESTIEITDSYYDSITLPVSDSVLEDLKMSTITKDFLDDILESDMSSVDSTTALSILSPDNINLYKTGHGVMKKFLQTIVDKSQLAHLHTKNIKRGLIQQNSKREKRHMPLCPHDYLQNECKPTCKSNTFHEFYGKRIRMSYEQLLQKIAEDLRMLELNKIFYCAKNRSSTFYFQLLLSATIILINVIIMF